MAAAKLRRVSALVYAAAAVECRQELLDVALDTFAVIAGCVTVATAKLVLPALFQGLPPSVLGDRVNVGIAVGSIPGLILGAFAFVQGLASM
jgi:hypothetical protein